MGDSCFHQGMKDITEIIANTTGSYAKCIPTGKCSPSWHAHRVCIMSS